MATYYYLIAEGERMARRTRRTQPQAKQSETLKREEHASMLGAFILWGRSLEPENCPYLLSPEHVGYIKAAALELFTQLMRMKKYTSYLKGE